MIVQGKHAAQEGCGQARRTVLLGLSIDRVARPDAVRRAHRTSRAPFRTAVLIWRAPGRAARRVRARTAPGSARFGRAARAEAAALRSALATRSASGARIRHAPHSEAMRTRPLPAHPIRAAAPARSASDARIGCASHVTRRTDAREVRAPHPGPMRAALRGRAPGGRCPHGASSGRASLLPGMRVVADPYPRPYPRPVCPLFTLTPRADAHDAHLTGSASAGRTARAHREEGVRTDRTGLHRAPNASRAARSTWSARPGARLPRRAGIDARR